MVRGIGVVVLIAAFAAAGCGDDSSSDEQQGQRTLTIYSSLPLQGDSRPMSESILNGERLALREARGRAGRFRVRFVSLDDAVASTGKWEAGQTSSNARRAAGDESAVVYLGEYNSGASAISIPILNDAGLLQISPGNTYVGLTRKEGADEGEPDKYYPTGRRTFGRVVQADHVQGAAQARYQKDEGCERLFVTHDKEVYGQGLAESVADNAGKLGVKVVATEGIDTKAANFRALAGRMREADCMFFGGITANKAVQLWVDAHAANPRLKLFGPDGVAETTFTKKLSPSAQRQTYLTTPTIDPASYPPKGRTFFDRYRRTYGRAPESYGIYGYEAMNAALVAIERAGEKGDDRQAVVDGFFGIRDRDSALGRYSIDENGDTTLPQEGANVVRDGQVVFQKVIRIDGR